MMCLFESDSIITTTRGSSSSSRIMQGKNTAIYDEFLVVLDRMHVLIIVHGRALGERSEEGVWKKKTRRARGGMILRLCGGSVTRFHGCITNGVTRFHGCITDGGATTRFHGCITNGATRFHGCITTTTTTTNGGG